MNIREALREAKRLKQKITADDFLEYVEKRKTPKPSTSVQVETRRRFSERIRTYPAKGAYIDRTGTLVIPFDCHPKYRWWAGGQSIADTLAELGVSEEIWEGYSGIPYPSGRA